MRFVFALLSGFWGPGFPTEPSTGTADILLYQVLARLALGGDERAGAGAGGGESQNRRGLP